MPHHRRESRCPERIQPYNSFLRPTRTIRCSSSSISRTKLVSLLLLFLPTSCVPPLLSPFWAITTSTRFTTASDPAQTKMELAGSTTEGTAAAQPLKRLNDHRRLVATIFPKSKKVGDDQDEVFHCAASQGMLSSVIALLAADENKSCDLPDRFGRTPLHWAAEQGRRNVVLALLRAGACVDPRSQREATPIMLAASKGHAGVVGLLLQYRAGESDRGPFNRYRRCRGMGPSGSTALHCAAEGGHLKVVELLLDAGFDKGQHDGRYTPVEVSARQPHSTSPAVTHLLLPSDMGGQLLYSYAGGDLNHDVTTLSGLIEGGAFLDWQNGTGETPLYRAAHLNHDTIVSLLLNAGADPSLSDCLGISPLHGAASNGCGKTVSDMLAAGAYVDQVALTGHSPLHKAVIKDSVDVVNLLLDAGASTEHRDTTHGQTPLSWACEGRLAPIVRLLVEGGADVESKSSAGLTPLHWACRLNDVESVEVLLNGGADPGVVDRAAASDGMEMSSCSSVTSASAPVASLPVAIDVIGLGYPLDRMQERTNPFRDSWLKSASRRLDQFAVRRIESAIQRARQECSWRRRGWLVILASRCDARGLVGAREKGWAECLGGSSYLPPDCASFNDTSDSCHLLEELLDVQHHAGKRSRNIDNGMGIAGAASRQHGHTSGQIGTEESVGEIRVSEVVAALLELAATEAGVFRRVIVFI